MASNSCIIDPTIKCLTILETPWMFQGIEIILSQLESPENKQEDVQAKANIALCFPRACLYIFSNGLLLVNFLFKAKSSLNLI